LNAKSTDTSIRRAQKKEKRFEEYLSGNKKSKDTLISKLTPILKNAKGKKAATVLLALHRLGRLVLSERGKQELYDAVNAHFGLALKNQSYQPYIRFDDRGVSYQRITDAEIVDMVRLLS
jgi:hypothetical protein